VINKNTFAGGVQARTVANGTVQEPVVVTLDGVTIELTLADAIALRNGLDAAIANVERAERAAVLPGGAGHHFIIGKTMHGMSAVPSKLPA
jgi:hypothetical protein